MTIKELARIDGVIKQIAETEFRIACLRKKASSTVQSVTGMPRGCGISDKVGNNAAEIADETARLQALKRKRKAEYRRLCRYIDGVTDVHVQRIMELHFIDRYTWTQTATRIGGGNSGDGVRKACIRYLQKSDKTR